VEIEWQAVEIALDVDLRAKPAARAAKCLMAPFFAPAAETCARAVVLSNIWITPAVRLQPARARKKASKVPLRDSRENRFQMVFQSPNVSGSARQVILCTVEIMQCFQKPAIVSAFLAASRAYLAEDVHHQAPGL
jgi:hypothetical protein